jgi:hypothetical protein
MNGYTAASTSDGGIRWLPLTWKARMKKCAAGAWEEAEVFA